MTNSHVNGQLVSGIGGAQGVTSRMRQGTGGRKGSHAKTRRTGRGEKKRTTRRVI